MCVKIKHKQTKQTTPNVFEDVLSILFPMQMFLKFPRKLLQGLASHRLTTI